MTIGLSTGEQYESEFDLIAEHGAPKPIGKPQDQSEIMGPTPPKGGSGFLDWVERKDLLPPPPRETQHNRYPYSDMNPYGFADEGEARDYSKNPVDESKYAHPPITPDTLMELRGIDPSRSDQTMEKMNKFSPVPGMEQKSYEGTSVDRVHYVPLVASALTDDNGAMYGMAIDHRIAPRPEYEKHLWDHEAFENEYMNHLTKIGYSSQDAYHKAHDWSTERESAAVEAEFGKDGLEDYKQHWRDASKIAAEPTDRDRHPDAHTTRHKLDEVELAMEFPKVGKPNKPTEADTTAHEPTPKLTHEIAPNIPGGGPERIAAPAIRSAEGKIFSVPGGIHADAVNKILDEGHTLDEENWQASQGFLTSTGRFVSREQAVEIAKEAEQVNSKFVGKRLLSEDLKETSKERLDNLIETLKEVFKDSTPRR